MACAINRQVVPRIAVSIGTLCHDPAQSIPRLSGHRHGTIARMESLANAPWGHTLRFVLEVELSGERKLPHEDAQQVIEHLRDQGWHLQLPPRETLAAANHPAYRSSLRQDDGEE